MSAFIFLLSLIKITVAITATIPSAIGYDSHTPIAPISKYLTNTIYNGIIITICLKTDITIELFAFPSDWK